MTLDIEKLKREVVQLGELDQAAQQKRAARVTADQVAQNANAAFATAESEEVAAFGTVSSQINYITGLLGVSPPTDDPSPD